jgi:hypothetical protein
MQPLSRVPVAADRNRTMANRPERGVYFNVIECYWTTLLLMKIPIPVYPAGVPTSSQALTGKHCQAFMSVRNPGPQHLEGVG